MRHITAGILAHVDSGKTTLSEAMLYMTGSIRKLGRVDHKDAHLDTHLLEKSRGITIFSSQARFTYGDLEVTLIDTPGHADFSAEMERAIAVMDYAILVISATDGVQSHTSTVWDLLRRYEVPVFIFINKTDLVGADHFKIMEDIRKYLSDSCVDMESDERDENIALCDDEIMEKYLESGEIADLSVAEMILNRKMFPCYSGSALKMEGIEDFLDAISSYTLAQHFGPDFGARVFKIGRDNTGGRLTHLRVTGGNLSVKDLLTYRNEKGEEKKEKVNQIRLYSGDKFETADSVKAGTICTVTGLTETYPGMGMGTDSGASDPATLPVLSYRIKIPDGADVRTVLSKLKILEEEEPMLHIKWNEELQQIFADIMGDIQIEILKSIVAERFDYDIEFTDGKIMYRETITAPVLGAGHFEPLRHYAEVHLLMEPLPRGSGLVFRTACSEDLLDRNWQRLIITHLAEKTHKGVLIGAPITDMRITIAAGRAHQKHTEGGDFRQAVYRAVRQGLMKAAASGNAALLEPFYSFRLEIPSEHIGRAVNDIKLRHGTFEIEESFAETAVITGSAPVSTLRGYSSEVASYSHGKGRLSLTVSGYAPCHNQDKIIESYGYDAQGDIANTADSVFCSHGAGQNVKWYDVDKYTHLSVDLPKDEKFEPTEDSFDGSYAAKKMHPAIENQNNYDYDERVLDDFMKREFGSDVQGASSGKKESYIIMPDPDSEEIPKQKTAARKKEYLIVDGYNMVFSWSSLKKIAESDIDYAREKLIEKLENYKAFKGCELVLVFDAYKVAGGKRKKIDRNGIHIVFTEERETGDMYIQKLADSIGPHYNVRVVTSDALIQLSALSSGVLRVSAREFEEEVEDVLRQIREFIAVDQEKNVKINERITRK